MMTLLWRGDEWSFCNLLFSLSRKANLQNLSIYVNPCWIMEFLLIPCHEILNLRNSKELFCGHIYCWHHDRSHQSQNSFFMSVSQKLLASALIRLQIVVEGIILSVYQVHVPLAAHRSEDERATCPVILKTLGSRRLSYIHFNVVLLHRIAIIGFWSCTALDLDNNPKANTVSIKRYLETITLNITLMEQKHLNQE